jgi:hypothetical protein
VIHQQADVGAKADEKKLILLVTVFEHAGDCFSGASELFFSHRSRMIENYTDAGRGIRVAKESDFLRYLVVYHTECTLTETG